MKKHIFPTSLEMARAAAVKAAGFLREAIARRGEAAYIAATGASQFEFLAFLAQEPGVEWAKTIMFHLDEYAGLPDTHPASFRRYLRERLIDRVHPGQVYLIQGDAADLGAECRRLNEIISQIAVDVAFVGIGENGHLAFNDPPADFATDEPYLLVELDEACRRQQLGEGWFPTLEDVPRQAISMSIRQIMKTSAIVCTVPDQRKAQAVLNTLISDISPLHPASILRRHPNAHLFLDEAAASMLPESFRSGE
jgi:glucosamine-6-phosphate deaminase